ncbi:MAG: hypothetical protein ABID40_00010 [Candidatus Bipolaricaulota bacterium]
MTHLRKPLVRTVDVPRAAHGYRSRLIVTLKPGALLVLREPRRRDTVELDLAVLFVRELIARRAHGSARGTRGPGKKGGERV